MIIRVKKIIQEWYQRSKEENEDFSRFISLWIAFNAWGSNKSKTNNDHQMIDWARNAPRLNNEYNRLIGANSDFKEIVKLLKSKCPVYDMRIGHESECKTITNINNFGEIIEVIYLIRCNLVHGSKDTDNDRDVILVKLAYDILSKVFEPIVRALGSN